MCKGDLITPAAWNCCCPTSLRTQLRHVCVCRFEFRAYISDPIVIQSPFGLISAGMSVLIMSVNTHESQVLMEFSRPAWLKATLHACKYPGDAVGGYLIGREEGTGVVVTDCFPVYHTVPAPAFSKLAQGTVS